MRTLPIVFAVAAFLASSGVIRAQGAEPEQPAATKPARSEVLRLRYAIATDTATVVQQALPIAVQRRVRVISEPRTNAIVVSADEGDLKDIRALVTELDILVPEKAQAQPAPAPAPVRKSVAYEVVLFMLAPGAEVASKLPRTSAGVIDAADPAAVLAKLREAVGQPGVTEVAKLAVTADDNRPWKWRQSAQVPMIAESKSGSTFTGYQEAVVELSINSETSRTGHRLGISGRVERFAENAKPAAERESGAPPAKHMSNVEFSSLVEDGKLVMSAVESAASKYDAGYVLFVRVK